MKRHSNILVERKKIIDIISKSVTSGRKIPYWLDNMQSLEFWNKLWEQNKFPKFATSETKFIEYMTLYEQILNSPLTELHKSNIVPIWITTTDAALRYIYLDYSTDASNKAWKESVQTFAAC